MEQIAHDILFDLSKKWERVPRTADGHAYSMYQFYGIFLCKNDGIEHTLPLHLVKHYKFAA